MLADPAYLKKCETLAAQGVKRAFAPGSRVARGFADLGFEEFIIHPNGVLCSLFTGSISELREDFLFPVFDQQELVDELFRRSWDVESIHYPDQRLWEVVVIRGDKTMRTGHRDLKHAFADVLLQVMECEC